MNEVQGGYTEKKFADSVLNKVGDLTKGDNIIERVFENEIAWKRAKNVIDQSEISQSLDKNGKYLDIGSGPGHIAQLLRRDGYNFVGSDPHIKPFASIRREQQESGGSNTTLAEAQKLPFMDGAFDGATMNFVFHHVPSEDWSIVFDEIERVIKSEGKFVMLEDVPLEAGDKSTAIWDNWTNGEISDLLKNLFGKKKNTDIPSADASKSLMDKLASGEIADLHLTDAQWTEIFADRGWKMEEEKEFFSHDPVTNKDIRHKKYVLRLPKKQ